MDEGGLRGKRSARATRRRLIGAAALCALLASGLASARGANAQAAHVETVSPLPASNYAIRRVCAPATGAQASCLALELVPQTPLARAHTHPIGIARTVLAAGAAAEPCQPKLASEGCYGLRPQDLQGAYSLPTTTEAAPTQTIAIVDAYDDPTIEKDLKIYSDEFHLQACTRSNGCLRDVNVEGKKKPLPAANDEWAREISLDVEIAHGICQACHILLVEAENSSPAALEAGERRAELDGANEISDSWYGVEPPTEGPAFNDPRTVITAAAGDFGYLNWAEQAEAGRVYYPASSPHVVAVGGTHLTLNESGAWIGESVWNSRGLGGPGATGGGCSEYFEAQPWQQQLPHWPQIGCGSERAVADIAADADPYTGVAIYDSTPSGEGHVGWSTLGGTSLSSPLITSMFALAGGANGVEYPARTLYENAIRNPTSLHDVESGSNAECPQGYNPQGLPNCTPLEEAARCAGLAICLAGPGYDGPSGVGTPDGIAAFQTPPAKAAQSITFTSTPPAAATVGGPTYAVGASSSSQLEVSLSSQTPAACALTGATVQFVAAGTCTIVASQGGDSEYFEAAAQAAQTFAVAPEPAPPPPLPPPPPAPPAGQTPGAGSLAFTSSAMPAPVADSNFSLLAKPVVSHTSGTITITLSFADAGTLSWLATFPNGRYGVFAAAACPKEQLKLDRRCRPARIAFAEGTVSVTAPGNVSVTFKPGAAARRALHSALQAKRSLAVTALLTFRSALGGTPSSRAISLADKL